MDMVGELRAAQSKAPSTTPALSKDDSRINPRNNFELITSLSDQLGAIEEQIGFMMGQIDSGNHFFIKCLITMFQNVCNSVHQKNTIA